jgi:hypothetical protein
MIDHLIQVGYVLLVLAVISLFYLHSSNLARRVGGRALVPVI